MYTIQNVITQEYSRYTSGGLRTFAMYKMARYYRDRLNAISIGWTIRRER